jgi:hypothetical protein
VDISLYESRIAISPDGKTVGFVENDGDEDFGMIFTNNRLTELGKGFMPVGVADGAKYIYYVRMSTDWEFALWVQRGLKEDTRIRLTGDLDFWRDIFFNRDMSQIIYSSSSRSAISDRGREPINLTGHVSYLITPYNTAMSGHVLGVQNFKNTFYQNTEGAIFHISNKFETRRVQGSADQVYLASDSKTLIFSRNNRIERIDGTKPNAEAVRLVDGNVRGFVATAKGDAVFFINSERDIMYQRGTGRAMNVAHDYSAHLSQNSLFKGETLFYIQDRELYSSTGRTGTRIGGLNGDVIGSFANTFGIYITIRDGRDTLHYQSTNGRRFTEIK